MESGPTRVEIELEPQEEKRSRRRATRDVPPAAVLDAPPGPTAEPMPPSGAPRRQLAITAVAVGLVAWFVGWALGRSGGEDGEAQTTGSGPTTASAAVTAAPGTTAVTDDTLPEAELPSTTRPRPSTTTTLPPTWTSGQVALDGRLTGLTDRLVVVTDNRVVSQIDLADGSTRRIELPRTSGTLMGVMAGDGWIMVPNDTGAAPTVIRDDGTIERPDEFTDVWGTFREFGTDGFWVVQYDQQTGRMGSARLLTIDGADTGVEISTRGGWIGSSDPAGGVLVNGIAVGSYRIAPDGTSSRVADGAVIAISAGHVLTYRCGDDLDTCEVVLADRSTGQERVVPMPEDATSLVTFGGWWGSPPTFPTLNADGTAALFAAPGSAGPPGIGVLDTVTGATEKLTTPLTDGTGLRPYLSAAWSSDGRFAFLTLANDVYAYDRTTRDLFPITNDGTFQGANAITATSAV